MALVEDQEATLKRFRRNGASIALEAANPAYETRIFRDDQVKVQGRLVGLIRTLLTAGRLLRPSTAAVATQSRTVCRPFRAGPRAAAYERDRLAVRLATAA